jgi:ABC-type glycerol-3-phosphate transport system substrate-binding protein
MMTQKLRFTTYIVLIFLAGCSSLAPLLSTPTTAPVLTATSTPQPEPTSTAPPVARSQTLRIWLPPRFDPDANTPSANLLKQRLADFENEHPGVTVEVRIKAETGDTDLLNSLSVTSKAAPSAMPDLVALSHSDMEDAALNGLLHPIDGLTTILDDPDWYAFAREMGRMQNTGFGLPFAANAMAIVYRPAVFEGIPSSWTSIFESGNLMVYPASDPRAYFSLSLYLSVNDQLVDAQGALALNEETLTRVLSFHKRPIDSLVVPLVTKDYQTDQQSMPVFYSGEAGAAVIWLSSDLDVRSGKYIPVLGLDDAPYSLADGWVWSLAGSDVEKQSLAVELATYLVDSGYMSSWTKSSGYLPTRPQALDGWEEDAELTEEINEILQSAYPVPSDDVLAVMSPLLQEALIRIFNGEQPEAVARSVIESLE